MSINTKQIYKLSVKRATNRRRRQQHHQQRRRRTNSPSIGRSFKTMVQVESKSKLSQKLQALKDLIPTHNGEMVKPDQLFKETADYIVLLRTRVLVLQKLIEYYGNNPDENEDALLL
ncbi:uncharacterized protein LOC130735661 [Lotus japonicus]|uniref:BHLH domain-containing protein n=1 Tax=Lotus japonicus TaxID=34305 RepID=I3SJF7_LOTJA|nr:uncharacterized protein LOC130735661 [Lotus japonicus]AFK40399.1 unknown [Lotus japonicus]